tara:strand:+ start:2266 stop:2439 length:174 start_codon:yes stop_codon:yes gene_type:complete
MDGSQHSQWERVQNKRGQTYSVEPPEAETDDSAPSWFSSEPAQVDMLSPELLGTGRK